MAARAAAGETGRRLAPDAAMRIFSGIQPTGELHLGNYFGALQNWVRLQDEYECVYAIVDYHAITQRLAPDELPRITLEVAADLLACGIDPQRSLLFVQSHVPEHTELAWVLACFTSYGDLTRMTQFKDKAEQSDYASAGLFSYPVLQAADILLYGAGGVPVGEDQLQHLELTRRIARRFNQLVGEELFSEPETILSEGKRVMSLADPEKKMSKSLGPGHYIGLMEDADARWKKIRAAVTATGGRPGDAARPGVENLLALLRLAAPAEVAAAFDAREHSGTLLYKDLKEALHEHLSRVLEPIQDRRAALTPAQVRQVLARGAERAGEVARATMEEVRRLVGVGPASLDDAARSLIPGS